MIFAAQWHSARRVREMGRSSRFVLGFVWAAVLTGLAWLTIDSNGPTVLHPWNLVLVLPAWMALGWYAILFIPAVFIGWCWTVFRDRSAKVPPRSFALFGVVALLSLCIVSLNGECAIEYHGVEYLHGIWLASIAWWLGLTTLACFADRRPSLPLNLAFHFALFSWLAWYALPYMGELP
jgi:hypothetical protein